MQNYKNAHGITAYSMRYTHTHDLHMAGKGTEMRQVGATVWHDYTHYFFWEEGGKTGNIVQYHIFIKRESLQFLFSCFLLLLLHLFTL